MNEHGLFPSRRRVLGLIGASALLPTHGHAAQLETLSGAAFGTTWRITGVAGTRIERLRPGIDRLFGKIDGLMSPWRPDSVISMFNTGPAGRMAVDPVLADVTGSALRLASDSNGAFDPTVGPLVARWGFGPIQGSEGPGWDRLSTAKGQIAKAQDDVTLDLCGIAKGYALDAAVHHAHDLGFTDLLMDLGGELRAMGQHPSGRNWRVAVEHPLSETDPVAVIRLPDGASVATSGLRAQSYALNGQTYGHIIDPSKGAPATGRLLSVTVLADTAMTADGWATALFAAGETEGPILAGKRDLAALFILGDARSIRTVATRSMQEFMA